jgi:hypothetical protein
MRALYNAAFNNAYRHSPAQSLFRTLAQAGCGQLGEYRTEQRREQQWIRQPKCS